MQQNGHEFDIKKRDLWFVIKVVLSLQFFDTVL